MSGRSDVVYINGALSSFFLSLFSKTQPNHWTKRMTSTRLATHSQEPVSDLRTYLLALLWELLQCPRALTEITERKKVEESNLQGISSNSFVETNQFSGSNSNVILTRQKSLERSRGKQMPSASILFFRTNLIPACSSKLDPGA